MDIEGIRKLRLAEPFQPFYVITKDGRRLFVDKPYHIGIASDGSHMMVVPGGKDINHLFPDQVQGAELAVASEH